MTITVTMRKDRLEQLTDKLPVRARTVVDNTSSDIRNSASQLARRETGSLAASVYISNGEESDYSQRAGEARSRNPEATIVPEVRPEFVMSLFGGSKNAYVSVVGTAVAHGLFNELGTRFMSSAAFMIPSVEGASSGFVAEMSKVADL